MSSTLLDTADVPLNITKCSTPHPPPQKRMLLQAEERILLQALS